MGDLVAPLYELQYLHGYLTVCVEPKDKVKAKLGRSPDEGDAVILSFWDTSYGSGGGIVV